MSLIRGVILLVASFGFLAAIGMIIIGVMLWPPSILLVFAALWYSVRTFRQARRETAERIRMIGLANIVEQPQEKQIRKSRREAWDDFKSDLPSALD